jgi:eukaryotic-like serine/threonine-protein kinase
VTSRRPAVAVDLDEFRLVRVLGQGGMGSVYLGYDTVLERDVAIKLLRDRDADDDARQRFLTEARAIARLDHPNVIAIFRASTTRAGHPYLVQELVRGHSLDRIELPVTPARAIAIALGIARGLAAAHRRGILHRDVKPANVMIDDDGTPKLLDFGVAKLSRLAEPSRVAAAVPVASALDQTMQLPQPVVAETLDPQRLTLPLRATAHAAADPTGTTPPPAAVGVAAGPTLPPASDRETEPGAIVGTPRYMAPEIWRGKPASERSDLYSLGALLYELVTGAAPHPHPDRSALEAAVVAGPAPRPVDELAPGIDAALAELITACLARAPGDRPESADEVAHRIERIVAGTPPVPDGNPYPGLAPFGDEHRAVFYGRGTDITTVIDRLRSAPLVVVAGDSGIGKSSLCRAGVLPAIAAGGLGDRRAWRSRAILVGRHAAASLRDALSLASAPELSTSEVVRAAGATSATGLVIFLDQFEELVTLNAPGEAAEAATLIASLARGVPGVKVLIGVRGDFLTRVAALPELGTLMMRGLHLLRALTPADARDAVTGPARAKGVRFETPALVETLASSIAGQPGALPLLSFALAELWQRRDVARAVIPAAALDAIGGVSGGLARHADAVVAQLGRPERVAARRIALLLVTHDDTRAERDRRELCPDDDPAAIAALEAMIAGRLVVARHTASGDPVYELAHDSLISAWSTLRGWRDELAGQRGLRTRLAGAADDWRRLGRRRDALWNRAQLAEVAALDELSGGDRDFLTASRRAARKARLAAIALAASLPAVALATGLLLQHRSQAARDRAVGEHVASATQQVDEAKLARDAATRDRTAALQLFDADRLADAEPVWARAQARLAEARTSYAAAASELEAAVLIDGQRSDVRTRMARVLFDHATLAELAYDHAAARELAARLDTFDARGSLAAAWHASAALTVDAPGAVRIDVRPYLDRDGRLELGTPVASVTTSRLTASVAAGSYLIELEGSDGLIVRDPVLLGRGETLQLPIRLPRAADVPAGMVYVPPGRFLVGGGPRWEAIRSTFLRTGPLRAATTGGYLIAIAEVTFADWMVYLRALPPDERERRRPAVSAPGESTVQLAGGREPGEPFTLTLKPTTAAYVARQGEPIVYPDRYRRKAIRWENAPVSGISIEDARAYVAWLASTRRLPGARLCAEHEWERAARGADGRTWAHGERLDADDANIDVTYQRAELAYGPDEVRSHPASTSPLGLFDAAGNVWEWVESPPDSALLRGGCWYQGATSANAANRVFSSLKARWSYAGLRVCATPS